MTDVTKPTKGTTKTIATLGEMPKPMESGLLIKAIDANHKAVSKAYEVYQVLGTQALMAFARKNTKGEAINDIGPVNRLLAGMPLGSNRNAMGQWLLTYGALKVSTEANRKDAPLAYDKTKKTDPEAAWADHWTGFAPQKPIEEEFDLQKALHGALTRAKGKFIKLGGVLLSQEEAERTLRVIADMAGEKDYKPEVKQQAQAGRRAEDAPQAADTPKAKGDAKRLPAAA